MNKIIAAAIHWKGIVYTGVRHGFIIKQIVDLGQITSGDEPIKAEHQGFIDSKGVFWTRDEARDIAVEAGQIKPEHGTLYSEDLW